MRHAAHDAQNDHARCPAHRRTYSPASSSTGHQLGASAATVRREVSTLDRRSGRVANLKRGRMETRRIRRLERRHTVRVVAVTIALGAIGVAIGLALPQSTTASALTLAVAASALALIALRADPVAPSHGLRHVVRLPFPAAVAAIARIVLVTTRRQHERDHAQGVATHADPECPRSTTMTRQRSGGVPARSRSRRRRGGCRVRRDRAGTDTALAYRAWARHSCAGIGTVTRRAVTRRPRATASSAEERTRPAGLGSGDRSRGMGP